MKPDVTLSGDAPQFLREHPESLFFIEILICMHKQNLLNTKNIKWLFKK